AFPLRRPRLRRGVMAPRRSERRKPTSLENEDDVHLHPVLDDLATLDLHLRGGDLAPGHAAKGLGRPLDRGLDRVLEALRRRRDDFRYARNSHGPPPGLV